MIVQYSVMLVVIVFPRTGGGIDTPRAGRPQRVYYQDSIWLLIVTQEPLTPPLYQTHHHHHQQLQC